MSQVINILTPLFVYNSYLFQFLTDKLGHGTIRSWFPRAYVFILFEEKRFVP